MSRRNRNAGPRPAQPLLHIEVDFTTGKKCGKRRFATRADAELVLGLARGRSMNGDSRRKESRIYFCTYCEGYHLTSQDRLDRDTPLKTC